MLMRQYHHLKKIKSKLLSLLVKLKMSIWKNWILIQMTHIKQHFARYEELLELDPKVASHFGRVINMTLHRKLGIAPPIGKQTR